MFQFFSILVFVFIVQTEQVKGETCNTSDFKPGTCASLPSCGTAQRLIMSGSPPTFCTGELSHLVCCPSEDSNIDMNENTEIDNGNNKKNPCHDLLPLGSGEDAAENHCIEYSHLVCERITPPALTNPANKVLVNRCGHKVVPLIVGGTKAHNREFPHMARLGYGQEDNIKWGCGGTLISESFVLSAAHCLHDKNFGTVNYVQLGITDFEDRRAEQVEFAQRFAVAERISHPQYRPNSKYYDVSLLKLDRKAVLNKYVIPACLPKKNDIEQSKAIATGWGHTTHDGNSSEVLMKVVLEFFTHAECNQAFSRNRELRQGIDNSTQVCAGSHTEEMDTCQGDSGGPLQVYHTVPYCMYDVVGVTSFGKACAVINRPAVYSRIAFARQWIVDNIWPN